MQSDIDCRKDASVSNVIEIREETDKGGGGQNQVQSIG
jgi:hypothetical protein